MACYEKILHKEHILHRERPVRGERHHVAVCHHVFGGSGFRVKDFRVLGLEFAV